MCMGSAMGRIYITQLSYVNYIYAVCVKPIFYIVIFDKPM